MTTYERGRLRSRPRSGSQTAPGRVAAVECESDADRALYRARADDRDTDDLWEPDVRRGLLRNEFRLHYQPIVDLKAETVVGFEALARWQHPERGLLPPAAFVHLAEDTGSIVELGRWVLGEACRQLADWQMRFPRQQPLRMGVNVSPGQLHQPSLVHEIAAALLEAGVDPNCLVLELTETMIALDNRATLRVLRALRRLGIRIALDDFGTGYCSLRYLRSFPLDALKIPRYFVQGIERSYVDSALARATLQLGDTFGLAVVAEGVETPAQLETLQRLGCRFVQGYHVGRPRPPTQLESTLAAQSAVYSR